MANVTVYDPKKNRPVSCGRIIGRTFYRTIKPQHFMKITNGYGIQEEAFQNIYEKIDEIILVEKYTDTLWASKPRDWLIHGRVVDYGHGKQRFLSLNYMRKVGEEKKEEKTKQLKLDL